MKTKSPFNITMFNKRIAIGVRLGTAKLLLTFLFLSISAFNVNAQNYFTNGSLNNPTGLTIVGQLSGWSTPQVSGAASTTVSGNDLSFTGYQNNANQTVTLSPDGGTFVSMSDGGPGWYGILYFVREDERIRQNVSGLVVGRKYELSFYGANFGAGSLRNPGRIKVSFRSSTLYQTSVMQEARGWTKFTHVFTATSSSGNFEFDAVNTGSSNRFAMISIDGIVLRELCSAGITSPVLTTNSLGNNCPSTTANLTSITSSSTPSGAVLTWHTATPATNANKISSPNSVAAGTYYAAFYDSANNCYSNDGNGTTPIAVTISDCCNAGIASPILSDNTLGNSCPDTTVDLTSITASNTPSGVVLSWHIATPATDANKIESPNSVGAGTYYAAFHDSANNCYSNTGNGTTAVTVTIEGCCVAGNEPPKL